MKSIVTLLLASAAMIASSNAMAAPNVVVSIKPIHSLVAAIMQGVAEPELIVDGGASPHTYSLKPSNARAIEGADVVFWVGDGLEKFLEKPLHSLAGKATVVELDDAKGLEKLPFREGGPFEGHDHGEHEGHDHAAEAGSDHNHDDAHKHEDGHDHEEGEYDMHLWLDPANAKAMAVEIEKTLMTVDPANAKTYQENTKTLVDNLDVLDKEIAETVAPIKDKPFVVFHDAYQYFEHHYGVKTAGSITVSPESIPGAERIKQIHAKVKELNATCVFAEPQFEPKLVNVVIEGTQAKSGTLDPEAATLEAGPDLYFKLMRGIATSLKDCLS
ncbi:zinc ABC transporter substrate-binding protein ZnuA [Agrobacterium rubi]|uniref:High-affinity zinc uptake system protein ZnuA n=1 Tax=Agrobacterium rubi TaxID=28099 RepID=A0AAE7R2E1_9HYPH|nr:zinc ABC transporter substrate-binding protein ZnuA [Agrobacterium rubi]NTE86319.1 zinc ABC transporter substrate-binding protein ZnuA [Agrobacterium rubi]NTF02251.1 zinc ABC transporter substrate-binding protein ZnuA [Agrobacterium rubi]NTF36495.1 zinc ABC transporter substrate-binding protein ZnuA [Agrobacterium rubi]OCJ44251.1 zinc ABC transporter substrate-binding protein [Agrobacterium rubi]QTF98962.1 zinc ABC transporter substrate-binding protein ZnuA [Agrobacterium rubi]